MELEIYEKRKKGCLKKFCEFGISWVKQKDTKDMERWHVHTKKKNCQSQPAGTMALQRSVVLLFFSFA